MTTRKIDAAPGSRDAAMERAKVRAREERVDVYVLRYRDRDRLYTTSLRRSLSQGPVDVHGYWTARGMWVPMMLMTLDDAITMLRQFRMTEAADELESRRGDQNP